jgi:cell division protein FtsB
MGSNNLSVEITADIASLQQKFAVARAETAALGAEMSKLAKQSAAGTLDVAGQSQFAQIAQDYLKAKSAAAGYSE